VNPIDELASLLPPGPPSRELPHRHQHEADLLAIIDADQAAGPLRSSALAPPGSRRRRWLAPSAAAIAVVCAVVVVAVAAVAVRGLSGPGRTTGSRPPAPQGSGAPAGPPAGTQLTATRHWTVPAGTFSSVVVSTDDGPVTVSGSTAASAAVTATPSYQGTAPAVSYQISGGALTVGATCPQERRCQVGLQLVVPAGVPVRASTSLGIVRLTGLKSRADATSSLGNLYLAQLSGSVTAQTDEGSVSATDLSVHSADLSSDLGSIDAEFSIAPETVTASSQLGSVTIQLPSGTSYAVTASADLGSTSVTVPQSPVSRHVVKASSQLGSVTVSS
jgi:hypothetical protein